MDQITIKYTQEAIFEPTFSNNSHGFRPNRGTRTAIFQARGQFTEVNWFIEADISKCFDTQPQDQIIEQLKKKINDQVFMDLIRKCFKAGYVDRSGNLVVPQQGTPQGSILSPILCNILQNILDNWLSDYAEEFNIGSRKRANPIDTKQIRGINEKTTEQKRKIRANIHNNRIKTKIGNDPNYKRMRFIRYADDFIIGVIGSHQDCQTIKKEQTDFLSQEQRLELSEAKTQITHASKDKARFQGYDLAITPYQKRQQIKSVGKNNKEKQIAQTSRQQIQAPQSEIVSKLASKGYCKKGKQGAPTRVGRLIHMSLPMIIEHYLRLGRGIINYYSCTNNFTIFKHRICYILKYSCALTIASKLNQKTKKQVFKKFGYDLQVTDVINDKVVAKAEFKDSTLTGIKQGFGNLRALNYDPMSIIEVAANTYPRTRALFKENCQLCGSDSDQEIHHVKHLKRSNKNLDYMTKLMSNMNRKQIVLCRLCHNKVHRGEYSGPKQ